MRMHRNYTSEEISFVKKNVRGRSYLEMTKMFNKRFGLRISLKQMERLMYKHKLRNGIGSFRPGHVPANKGKTHKPRQGYYRPIGSERIDSGYVTIKNSDRKYRGNKNWKRKHTVIWEAANGKVPKGHVVIFADGNTRNFALDNLLLVSLKELAIMNKLGLISPHRELTLTGKAVANLKMAICDRKRKAKKGVKK